MAGIVCAIRGGPYSRPTIEKSISLSIEKGQKIFFLYIVNLEFLSNALHANIQIMEEELREMGEFILLLATESAKAKNVTAEGVIRKGKVIEEIVAQCKEVDADYILLGKPQMGQSGNVLNIGTMDAFADRIEEASGAKVVYVEGNDAEESKK